MTGTRQAGQRRNRRAPGWLAAIAALALAAPPAGAGHAGAEPPPDPGHYQGFDLQIGEAVFSDACLACHGGGAEGAPRADRPDEWLPRLQQDLHTLVRHALDGHRNMPAKGGCAELSDGEVAAAVAYVVHEARQLIDAASRGQTAARCDPFDKPEACDEKELRELMTLRIFWLLGGSERSSAQ